MHTIVIDDDIYHHLVQNTRELGETASQILRRLLRLPTPGEANPQPEAPGHELSVALRDPRFSRNTAAVDRFLCLLEEVYKQKRTDFEKVLAIQGRGRKYFAKSQQEIEKSGNSTQPRNISGSPYWVMTNSPTSHKRQLLADVLKLLGYSEVSIKAATEKIQ